MLLIPLIEWNIIVIGYPQERFYNSLTKIQFHYNSILFLIGAVVDLLKFPLKCPLNQKSIIIKKKLEIITLSVYLTLIESYLHISFYH